MYCDLTYANTYFSTRLYTDAWDDSSVTDRTSALVMATNAIDRLDFAGSKADASQELEFPRNEDTEIPDDIKIAACEIALALLDGVDPEQEFDALRIQQDGFSSVRTSYTRSLPAHMVAMIPSARAWTYLHSYLREPGNVKLTRVS